MAYTYDLTTNVGKVRRDIGDTDLTAAQWTDEELQSFVDEGGNVKAAAGLALTAWAAYLSTADELSKVGSWQGDRRDVVAKMSKLADRYLELGGYEPTEAAPSFLNASIDWDFTVQAERILQEEDE